MDAPAGLYTLAARYADHAVDFIRQSVQRKQPFLLYYAFNHVHAPSTCGEAFCGRSQRGPVGDACEEMDAAVGRVMDTLRDPALGIDHNTCAGLPHTSVRRAQPAT